MKYLKYVVLGLVALAILAFAADWIRDRYFGGSGIPAPIERKIIEFRTRFDTVMVLRDRWRPARAGLTITDTVEVKEFVALTDSVILADSAALVAARVAIEDLSDELRRRPRERTTVYWAEALYAIPDGGEILRAGLARRLPILPIRAVAGAETFRDDAGRREIRGFVGLRLQF
jgi:hypothetical protein